MLEAIVGAQSRLQLEAPRRPWLDVLPEQVLLVDVRADPRAEVCHRLPGRMVALGLLDAPADQDQYPLVVDLEAGGGLVIYGSGGSGRTTALRSVVAAAMSGSGGIVGRRW